MNIYAQALGRMNKGKKKTMSKAALEQRRAAAKAKRKFKPEIIHGPTILTQIGPSNLV